MTLPLSGIRIVDLSRAIAGPSGSQILGDLGAEVIKIEPPEGDGNRRVAGPAHKGESFYFMAYNRNKKSVLLDLGTPLGRQAFYDLVKISDVVYDNYRAGVLERLKADYETIRKINPRIICCSITGWGASGPLSHRPSLDINILGQTGFLSITGTPGGPPVKPGEAIGDVATGMYAVIGILAALNRRHITGEGCKVDLSMLESVMAMMNYTFSYFFCSGIVPKAMGSQHLGLIPYGIYKTKDGYLTIGTSWPRVARVIDAEWMIEDPRFKEMANRLEHREEFTEILEERLSHANTEDWLRLFEAEDIIAGPINTIDQVVEDPQVKHQSIILTMDHPLGGQVRLIGCPIKMDGLVPDEYIPAPLLGQHTDAVLSQLLGYSAEHISQLKKEQEEHTEERNSHLFKRR
jgi:crotonobetainyl-CoA:carnitine CoA-transferase CaiB-like acyl-CoA transferase